MITKLPVSCELVRTFMSSGFSRPKAVMCSHCVCKRVTRGNNDKKFRDSKGRCTKEH